MSGYPPHQEYDDGYGHQRGNTDSYYQDDQQYYDQHHYDQQQQQQQHQHHDPHQAVDGYYDES